MKRHWMWLPALAVLVSGCVTVKISGAGWREELREETIEDADSVWTRNKVAILTLDGVIQGESTGGLWGRESSVVWIKDQLKAAADDPHLKAVVLRIDSPGGDVTASDIIYRELRVFREEQGVPVMASILDTGASGGYYVAMAADRVYAHPTSILGSIGVIATLPEVKGLADMIGLRMRIIKSGDNKDIGSIWRAFQPGEHEILQGMIDSFHERFLRVAAEGRPNLSGEKLRELADGRVYTATEAAENGLIDGILYLDDVIELAKAEAGLDDARVVVFTRPNSYRGHIYASTDAPAPRAGIQIDTGDALDQLRRPKFQYLWVP